jgi:hypothetical protein
LNGSVRIGSSNTSSVGFLLTPGTYTYFVRGFVAIPLEMPFMAHFPSGQIRIVASNLTIPVHFSPTAKLKVVAVGIPANASWNASVNSSALGYWGNISGVGPTAPATLLMIVFANGTYSYRITFAGNYSHWDSTGSIFVGVATATLTIPTGGTTGAVDASTLDAIAIVLVLIGAGSIILVLYRRRLVGPPG